MQPFPLNDCSQDLTRNPFVALNSTFVVIVSQPLLVCTGRCATQKKTTFSPFSGCPNNFEGQQFSEQCYQLQVNHKFYKEEGEAGHKLCHIAKSEHVTLIVMGTRGLGTLRRTILGSVSDYVLHHAHCPVIICRQ